MQSLWMLFATFVFAVMGVCVKYASVIYSTSEIVIYRGVVGTLFIIGMVTLRGGSLKTALPWHHLWRSVVGVCALWTWFYSFSVLPLAMVMTLNYTSPIWIAAILLIGGLWSRTKNIDWPLTGAILMSFAGVVLLLQPAIRSDQWPSALLALGSGFLSALAYLQVRKLGQMGEPEYRVVFYFSLATIAAGFLTGLAGPLLVNSAPMVWHQHSAGGLALLLGIGITATIAQVAMTRAYRLGRALVTANLQYTGIIFAAFWGVLLWDEQLGLTGWSGILVILASGVAATFYNARNPKTAAAPATEVIATEV